VRFYRVFPTAGSPAWPANILQPGASVQVYNFREDALQAPPAQKQFTMARLGSSRQHRSQTPTAVATETVAPRPLRKQGEIRTYQVDQMCRLIDAVVDNLQRQQKDANGGVSRRSGQSQSPTPGAPRRSAPQTLDDHLQRLIMPPNFAEEHQVGQPLNLEHSEYILTACSKLLRTPMNFDPAQYNKATPGSNDAIDNDPSIPRACLKNVVAGMTLVVPSLTLEDARKVKAVLERAIDKIHDLEEKNLGPSVVASKPGDKLDFALGNRLPPHPMTPPTKY
jgi:hypothetical protein